LIKTTPPVQVPDTLEEAMSPDWLSAALGQRFRSIRVTSATRGPIVSRVSTNARFRIACADPLPDGLPAHLCIKGYFSDCSESAVLSRAAGEPEALFYRELARTSRVRTLRAFYSDVDPVTHHGVVISGDVVEEGATFLDALSAFSPEQAARSLEQYAVLHGRTWESDQLTDARLAPRVEATLRARGVPEIRGNFDGPIGAAVPSEVRDPDRLVRVVRLLQGLLSSAEPHCLLHGDAHIGNLFLDATGSPCLVDWQLVQRGPWYLDVGYHIACAIGVEDRRRTERDLLEHYLARLGAEGGAVPTWDEAWRLIRVGMVYGFFLWAITLKVAPEITTAMLERLGAAVADHDALSVIEQM
jgi:phosphotransferase family enzyme